MRLDDPVARHIPEFAANGKAEITLRHLLTHTAGIPNAHRQWSRESWDEILAKICAAAPEPGWKLGVDCEYHVASAWYVLGRDRAPPRRPSVREYVREAILAPLGIRDFWVGMERDGLCCEPGAHRAPLRLDAGKLAPIDFWAWSGSAESLAICRPAAAAGAPRARSPASTRRCSRGGAPSCAARRSRVSSRRAARRPRPELRRPPEPRRSASCSTRKEFGPASAWYGNRVSPRTFGHAGYYSSVAFGDPAHELAVALAWNGFRAAEKNDARAHAALDALYEDLGL